METSLAPSIGKASATKTIKLATGVVSAFTRHPATLASTLGTLDELTAGRIIFGVGTGNPVRLKEKLGMDVKRPFAHVRDTAEITKKLLIGGTVSYQGKILSFRTQSRIQLHKTEYTIVHRCYP